MDESKTKTMDFSDLKAVFINCSLKKDKSGSHTQLLIDRVANVMRSQGVTVSDIYLREHQVAFGILKDASDINGEVDDWPKIQKKIMEADILVIGTPIWLGVKSSVATLAIERLYAFSSELNEKGQWNYYGKVGGCIITGNEDGAKHCAMDLLYALQHIGFTVPPQADCAWLGEAGPGPSYGDSEYGGKKLSEPAGLGNDFTNRNATYMAWNQMHMARILKGAGGLPSVGNTKKGWQDVANAVNPDVK